MYPPPHVYTCELRRTHARTGSNKHMYLSFAWLHRDMCTHTSQHMYTDAYTAQRYQTHAHLQTPYDTQHKVELCVFVVLYFRMMTKKHICGTFFPQALFICAGLQMEKPWIWFMYQLNISKHQRLHSRFLCKYDPWFPNSKYRNPNPRLLGVGLSVVFGGN